MSFDLTYSQMMSGRSRHAFYAGEVALALLVVLHSVSELALERVSIVMTSLGWKLVLLHDQPEIKFNRVDS